MGPGTAVRGYTMRISGNLEYGDEGFLVLAK